MGKGHTPAYNHPWRKFFHADKERKARNKRLREEKGSMYRYPGMFSVSSYLNNITLTANGRSKHQKINKCLDKLHGV